MHISIFSVPVNSNNECSESDNIKSLSRICQLPEHITNDLRFFVKADDTDIVENENLTNMQPIIVATMISQYRVEAMLGGDQKQEDNPMYISDW
ncbi:hypothetical protein JGC56_09615 [Salmonella enterica subsp. enterica serovar Saintpaul]|nr:hypothetical protein [Salmonella enterica subsp. enterica serovar Saintpaul]